MSHSPILPQFIQLLGEDRFATGDRRTEHYRSGWRSGSGAALAVLFPDTLLKLWQTLQICVDNNCIIIMQAAKTGLTEGSTPSGNDYDREVVVINTLVMDDLMVLGNGEQVLSFPGTTLHKLETTLKPLSRAPHSVFGSSCLGKWRVNGFTKKVCLLYPKAISQ